MTTPTLAQATLLRDELRTLTPASTVVIDLDGTALWIGARLIHALHHLAHLEQLPTLITPATLARLPGLHTGAWNQFVTSHDLATHHPDRDWDQLYDQYRTLAWSHVDTDRPIAGLAEFVHTATRTGAHVRFVTGRTSRHRSATETTLARHGLAPIPLHMVNSPSHGIPQGKVRLLRRLLPADTDLRVFDDTAANLAAIRTAFPHSRTTAVRHPRITPDPTLPDRIPRITTFEHHT